MAIYVKNIYTDEVTKVNNINNVNGKLVASYQRPEPTRKFYEIYPCLRPTSEKNLNAVHNIECRVVELVEGYELAKAAKVRKQPTPKKPKQKRQDEQTPKADTTPQTTESTCNNVDEVSKQIAAALQGLKVQTQSSVNADDVRSIVRDELAAIPQGNGNAKVYEVKVIGKAESAKVENPHPLFDKVLPMVVNDRVTGRYPWLFGPAGSGKSTLASQIAAALQLPFYSVSSLQQKYELEGYTDATGNLVETSFYKAFTEGGIFLFDEASTTCAEVQIAFNSALANLRYNFPKVGMVEAHKDFHVIAADNTAGWGADKRYHARYELDASTLDRYIPVKIDYLDEVDLNMAQGDENLVAFIKEMRKVIEKTDSKYTASPRASKCIKALQAIGIYTDEEVMMMGLCGGWSQQDIKSIAYHLEGNTTYHKTFKRIANK